MDYTYIYEMWQLLDHSHVHLEHLFERSTEMLNTAAEVLAFLQRISSFTNSFCSESN